VIKRITPRPKAAKAEPAEASSRPVTASRRPAAQAAKPRKTLSRQTAGPAVEPAGAPVVVPPAATAPVSIAPESPARVFAKPPVSRPDTLATPNGTPNGTPNSPESTGPAPPPAAAAAGSARVEAEQLPPIPPILLEDDRPAAVPVSGPGQRYALGPSPPAERLEPEGELPDTYGTQQLLLAARDPHWLYAHWDLTRQQQRYFNSLSQDQHLILRVRAEAAGPEAAVEVHVHPESRHWFIHVDRAGARYICELGFYTRDGEWVSVSTSGSTLAPPDAISEETEVEFVTIPYELPLARLVALVKEAVRENVPLAQALVELRAQGHPALPAAPSPLPPEQWTPAQEQALAEVISMDHVRRVWMGSLEITELIRRQFVQELASMAAAQIGGPTSPSGGAVSSPSGGPPPTRGFWFNVNAELIVYGATEPTATVSLGGRKIKLRPDGTFSYRFALPDGQYELPAVAVSLDQTDGRAAELHFSRSTEYRGEVGTHSQDAGLKPPAPENV
jgi:uncharacterized protein